MAACLKGGGESNTITTVSARVGGNKAVSFQLLRSEGDSGGVRRSFGLVKHEEVGACEA